MCSSFTSSSWGPSSSSHSTTTVTPTTSTTVPIMLLLHVHTRSPGLKVDIRGTLVHINPADQRICSCTE